MHIDDLIKRLEDIKEEHGNIIVCVSEKDDYWGTLYEKLEIFNLSVDHFAQPKGPKSGESEKAVVFHY